MNSPARTSSTKPVKPIEQVLTEAVAKGVITQQQHDSIIGIAVAKTEVKLLSTK
jgi:hypothetical protein